MSGAVYWLQKQRKSELVNLADHVGLKDYEGLLKPDLEVALEEYMRVNQTRLAKDPGLKPFYTRLANTASPKKYDIKYEDPVETTSVEEVARKPRARRQTRAREEIEQQPSDSEPNLATSPRTPRTTFSFSQSIPLPPSPAVLADRIETQTTSVFDSIQSYVSSSSLLPFLNAVRTALSSVISIELFALFVEAWGLRAEALPMVYLTTLPAVPALGTGEIPIKIPDLFAVLTMRFWGPVGLWLLTSLLLPLVAAWFFNLTDGGRKYDPLSFNVVKGLLAWVVYACNGVGGESRERVQKGVPGGSAGLLIGAGIGILASLYEAVLKR